MSVKLMSKAWEMDIPMGQKMLLLALCDHANDDGVCYPSQEKLATKCSMSLRAIVNHLKWLEKHGILARERRQSTQRRKSNLYQITLEKYTPESANPAHADFAHADFAHAEFSPERAEFARSERAESACSYIRIEPSSINHQKEPSESCADLVAAAEILPANEILPTGKNYRTNDPKAANAKTWDSYQRAYRQRYGCEPIRNAQANALIANIVKAVGATVAPSLVAYYLTHNGYYHVRERHSLKALMASLQAVYTDWQTGKQITQAQAQQADRTQTNFDTANRVLAMRQARRQNHE